MKLYYMIWGNSTLYQSAPNCPVMSIPQTVQMLTIADEDTNWSKILAVTKFPLKTTMTPNPS